MTHNVKSVCPYCGVGCGLVLKTDGKTILGITGDKEHPANFGRLCTKGLTAAIPLTAPDRLTQAFHRTERVGDFHPIPVSQAHAQIAHKIRTTITQHGPDAFAFYVSGQMSTESQYLCNKLAKGFIGTNNIDSNSRLCMSSAASGYRLSLGADGPPGTYADFEHCDCFLVIGANMADCHPILFLRLLDRKKASGAKLIVVDPRRTATAGKADLYLPIKPGTDMAFLNGLLYLQLKAGKLAPEFIASFTEGWEELEKILADYPPARVAEITGLSVAQIEQAADWFSAAPEAMTLWTMGLNQSTHGTWHTNAICNLHLATGKIGRAGSGPFSLTGQPNAMGGREVGYLAAGLPGQRLVTSATDRAHLEQLWEVPAGRIQAKPGADAVTMFQQLAAGKIKVVWIICTNPVASMPNRTEVIAGLQAAELVIVQEAFHPTETSAYADILLPGALWAEAEGTMINSDRNVTLMQPAIPLPGETKADWEHVAMIARLLGYEREFGYANASKVFNEIRTTYNLKTEYDLRGVSYETLRVRSQQWPCAPADAQSKPRRYLQSDGSFRARIYPQRNCRMTTSLSCSTPDVSRIIGTR
jgi:sulfite reductase (NADPH) flavoprotein alpha-component